MALPPIGQGGLEPRHKTPTAHCFVGVVDIGRRVSSRAGISGRSRIETPLSGVAGCYWTQHRVALLPVEALLYYWRLIALHGILQIG